jgi:hypothetical protein
MSQIVFPSVRDAQSTFRVHVAEAALPPVPPADASGPPKGSVRPELLELPHPLAQ